MKDLSNKVAVVTGAASGIGRALAKDLAQEGCKLAINDFDGQGLEEVKRELQMPESDILVDVFDVSDREKVYAFADKVLGKFGAVDLVINNAGIAMGRFNAEELPYEPFEKIMDVNYWGMVYGSLAFLPHLQARSESGLVNISSIFGIVGVMHQLAYCSSKFAIRGFSESLRMEMNAYHPHLTITSVHPGGIKTNIVRNSSPGSETLSEAEQEQMNKRFEEAFITTADKAAEIIIKGVKKKKERVLVGPDAKRMARLTRLFPAGYTKMMMKVLQKLADNP